MTATERLRDWTSRYGRFCVLAARALHLGTGGYSDVRAAMKLDSALLPPDALMPIRTAGIASRDALEAAKTAGHSSEVLLEAIRPIRCAVAQEWDVTLPVPR